MLLAPSILNCTEEGLHDYLVELEKLGITYVHLDIMDGKFVPNSTKLVERLDDMKGFHFVNDTHLMIEEPSLYYRDYAKAGSDLITFHFEAATHPDKLIQKIHSMGKKAGISIKPGTPVEAISEYLQEVDLVLVMSVEPGFGGQKFMESSIDKVKHLSALKYDSLKYKYLIEVDGGINKDNAKLLADAGCDIVVMGTALLKEEHKQELVDYIHSL